MQNYRMNGVKRKLSVLTAAMSLMAWSATAAEYKFPSEGGVLSDPAAWGASAPGPSDIGVIQYGGTYTLSRNLQLSQLEIATDRKCIFDFTGNNCTMQLSTVDYPISVTGDKINTELKGGVWDFSNNDFRGTKDDGVFWLRDGAKIINAGHIYNSYNVKKWDIRLYEASKIQCSNYTLTRNGSGGRLIVAEGSTIDASATFASDRNNPAGALTYNSVTVTDTDSKISSHAFVIGYTGSRNTLEISNGGSANVTGRFTLGNSSGAVISSTNTVNIANGSLSVAEELFTAANSCDNVFNASDSVINVGAISNLGTRSVYDFQNCTVNIGNFRPFVRNGGRFRVAGSRTSMTVSDTVLNPFASDISANSDNVLAFDDGADVTLSIANGRWMSSSANCGLTIANGAKLTIQSRDGLYIGYDNVNGVPNCKDNSIEISSGGELNVDQEIRIYGTRNRIVVVVDNGTLHATTVRIGHSGTGKAPSPNCSLVIKGSAPKVLLSGGLTFHNDAVLRFEIPASGYSDGISAIDVQAGFVPNNSTKLEVDYAAYLAAGGGTVTLVSFKDPNADLAQWLAAQSAAMNLPTGTKLRLVQDENGYRITFKAMKYPGMVISIK